MNFDLGWNEELIRFWWPWPNCQGHSIEKLKIHGGGTSVYSENTVTSFFCVSKNLKAGLWFSFCLNYFFLFSQTKYVLGTYWNCFFLIWPKIWQRPVTQLYLQQVSVFCLSFCLPFLSFLCPSVTQLYLQQVSVFVCPFVYPFFLFFVPLLKRLISITEISLTGAWPQLRPTEVNWNCPIVNLHNEFAVFIPSTVKPQ